MTPLQPDPPVWKRVEGTWVEQSEDFASVRIEKDIYPVSVGVRAAYDFLDRAYVLLSSEQVDFQHEYRILLRAKDPTRRQEEHQMVLELCNSLCDYRLRHDVDQQTHDVRTLIVAQAFAEADLLEDGGGREG